MQNQTKKKKTKTQQKLNHLIKIYSELVASSGPPVSQIEPLHQLSFNYNESEKKKIIQAINSIGFYPASFSIY